jgi:hypothetical protein
MIAVPLGARLLSQDLGHVEEVRDVVYAKDTRSAERGIEHFIAAGKRTRVRSSRFRRSFGAARLDDDDGLGKSHFARGRKEGTGVADAFHVDENGAGLGIVAQVVDEIAPAHIAHGTYGDEGAKADFFRDAPIEHCGTEGTALADKAHTSRKRHAMSEGSIQAADGAHDAETVGADDAHATPPCLLQNSLFQRSTFGPDFLEAGGKNDGARDTGIHALADDARYGGRRSGDDRQIHGSGHRSERGICLHPEHTGALRVYRKHHAPKGIADEVPENGAPYTAGDFAGTDQGNARRRKERLKGMLPTAQNGGSRIGALVLGGHSRAPFLRDAQLADDEYT